jgi:hypothetical protein
MLGIGLFFIPFLAAPIYYFVYVLPAHPPVWAIQPVNKTSSSRPSGEPPLD